MRVGTTRGTTVAVGSLVALTALAVVLLVSANRRLARAAELRHHIEGMERVGKLNTEWPPDIEEAVKQPDGTVAQRAMWRSTADGAVFSIVAERSSGRILAVNTTYYEPRPSWRMMILVAWGVIAFAVVLGIACLVARFRAPMSPQAGRR